MVTGWLFGASYEWCWSDWLLVTFSCSLLTLWSGYWAFHLMALARTFYKFCRRKKHVECRGDEPWPGVSILKPLVTTDAHLAANLESFFNINYPLFELLFCVQNRHGSCVSLVEQLMAKYPHVDATVFVGGKQVGVNPKINNMQPGYEAAKYELIVISDSCIRMKSDSLLDMVGCLNERVGLVHQMPFVGDPTSDFVSVLEKVFFGTFYARVAMSADLLGINCTTGMSMLVRRRILDEVGGLPAFACYLAEDYFIARAVQQQGFQLTLAGTPALQMRDTRAVTHFQQRLMRWCKLRAAMVPLACLMEPLTDCMLLGILAAFTGRYLLQVDAIAFFLLHLLVWFLMDWLLFTCIQSGPPSFSRLEFVVAWLARELMAPCLVARALYDQRICWHHSVFRLRWGGVAERLTHSSPTSAIVVGTDEAVSSKTTPHLTLTLPAAKPLPVKLIASETAENMATSGNRHRKTASATILDLTLTPSPSAGDQRKQKL